MATVVLGWLNWRLLGFEPDASSGADSVASAGLRAAPAASARLLDDRPLADFGEISRRPLFTVTRRPFVASEATSAPTAPADIKLMGIAIEDGKKRALLRTAGQPRARWIAEGDTVDGWLLHSVRNDAATVRSDQATHELRLYPVTTSPAAPAGK
jgi:hypothetical protein